MSRRRPPPIEEPEKPLGEMTPTERAAYLAQVRRALRDDEVRRGARPPRSMREIEIWREGRAEREARQTRQSTSPRSAMARQRRDPGRASE
jgi:hypothetical protein